MLRPKPKRILVFTLAAQILWTGVLPGAQAAILGTDTLLQLDQRAERLGRVNSLLIREDVRMEMLKLGVNPEQVQDRLAALTDQELQEIEGRLSQLPAGGNLAAAIGVVFVILIILELVGATNIFTRL